MAAIAVNNVNNYRMIANSFYYEETHLEQNPDFLTLDSKFSNRRIDRSTGQLIIENCPITAEEVVTYFNVIDSKGNQQFPISQAEKHGFKYGAAIKVFRPIQEIEKAIDSFKMKPIVVGHKSVNIFNFRNSPRAGSMGESFRIGEIEGKKALFATTCFDSPEVIEKIDKGMLKDFSIGYDVKYVHVSELTPAQRQLYNGKFQGQAYDFVQTNIFCNHNAIIPPGTARCDIAQVADWLFIDNNYLEDNPMTEQVQANMVSTVSDGVKANEAAAQPGAEDGKLLNAVNSVTKSNDSPVVKPVMDGEITKEPEKKNAEDKDLKEELKKATDQLIAWDSKYQALEKIVLDLQQKETTAHDSQLQATKNLMLVAELKSASIAHDSLENEPTKVFDEYAELLDKHTNGKVNKEKLKALTFDQKIAFMMGHNSNKLKFNINQVAATDSATTKEIGADGMARFAGGKL